VPYDPPAEYLQRYDAQPYTGVVQPRLTADQLERAKRRPPAIAFDERDRQRLEALYDGEVSYHDAQLGIFVERMKRLGLWDDTVFVVTSDHGEEFFEHQSFGHGHSLFEELLHVPLLFRHPGSVPANGRITSAVSTIDIGPTIIEAAGVDAARTRTFEGQSLLSTMRGLDRPGPDVAFSDFLDDRRTVTAGSRWKLILRGINAEFFDLQNDPTEQREMNMQAHPIASRYCRILLGQFLGATNRARWIEAEQGTPANRFNAETTVMDAETRAQIRALGYAN
jgi:arylsulfatase A-like enzyme